VRSGRRRRLVRAGLAAAVVAVGAFAAPAVLDTRASDTAAPVVDVPAPTTATAPAPRESRRPASRAAVRTPAPTGTPRATTTPSPRSEPRATAAPTREATSSSPAPGAGSARRPTSTPTPTPAPPRAPDATLAEQIVALTNDARRDAGLAPLEVSTCATEQAADRTAVLVAEGRFEHDPLEPVLRACGGGSVGENLALGYPSAQATVDGWLASPGHRANLLGSFTSIGVGCTPSDRGPLCAQVFLG